MLVLWWLAVLLAPALSVEGCWVSSDLYAEIKKQDGSQAQESGFSQEEIDFVALRCGSDSEIRDLSTLVDAVPDTESRGQIILSTKQANPEIPLDLFAHSNRRERFTLTITGYKVESSSIGTVTLKTSRTDFRSTPPKEGDGEDRFPEYLTLELYAVAPYSVSNTNAEQNRHKLFLDQITFAEEGVKFQPQGDRYIDIYLATAEIDDKFHEATKDAKVSFGARYYILAIETPGTYDLMGLPLLPSVVHRYRQGELYNEEVYNYRSLQPRPSRKITVGNNKVTLGEPENAIVYKIQGKDSQLEISGTHVYLSCESGANQGEIVWGYVYADSVTISGQWPTVDDILDQAYRSRREVIDGVRYDTYSAIAFFDLHPSMNLTINSESIPCNVWTSQTTDPKGFIVLNLEGSRIQGILHGCPPFELAHENTVLRIGSFYSCENFDVYGGELKFEIDKCKYLQGNHTLTCRELDARSEDVWSVPNNQILATDGKIMTSYGVYSLDALSDVWSQYQKSENEHIWTDFEGDTVISSLWSDWAYILKFPRLHAASIVTAMKKDWKNTFNPLNVVKYSGHPTLELWRREAPLYSLYSKDVSPIVCLNKGEKLNLEDWTMKWSPSVFYIDKTDFTKYLPQFTEYSLLGSFRKVTQDGCECIGYQLGDAPNSALNLVIYTSNQSLIDALSGFSEIFSLVTPSTIDKEVVLHNPNGKNVLLVCFDDVPNDKSIDLWKMRMDSNLFVIGLPCRAVYDNRVFKALQDCLKLDRELDEFWTNVYDIAKPLINDYQALMPRVSLKIHRLDSIYMGMTNYVGTTIDCDLFASVLCKFGEETEIKATYVVTDTLTYDLMKGKSLNNLVLVPVSLSPPDYLSVSSIEFDVGKWRLVSSGYTNWINEQSVKYEIDTSKVGQLFVVSHTDSLTLEIPSGSSVTSVKGVSVIMDISFDNAYTSLPVSPLLSEDTNDSPLQHFLNRMKSFFSGAKLKATKPGEKSATFKGKWDQVKEIQGSFAVDSGAMPIQVTEVPTNVVASLQVKSSQESSVNLPSGVSDLELKMPVQVISGKQTLSYGSGVKSVKFNNITFNGGRVGSPVTSSLTLKINNNEKQLDVDNIKCCDYSDVTLDRLALSTSLEMGIGSKFVAQGATYGDSLALSVHFTINSLFNEEGGIPQLEITKDPTKVTLIYDNDESTFDMSPYKDKAATVYTFTMADSCKQALTTFEAENPNFKGDSNAVKAECSGNKLQLTLVRVPEPTPSPTLPGDPDPSKVDVGAIVGGVIGALAVITIGVVVVVLVLRHRKKQLLQRSSSSFSNETASTTAE